MAEKNEWEPENPYEKYKDASGIGCSIIPFDVYIAYAEGVRDGQSKLVKCIDKEIGWNEPDPSTLVYGLSKGWWQTIRQGVGLG